VQNNLATGGAVEQLVDLYRTAAQKRSNDTTDSTQRQRIRMKEKNNSCMSNSGLPARVRLSKAE
jgi:hypothetical protein